ncbi:MAG TPA: 16S rRNA (guanine(966)-N(2))-methyltransferase RsmD [Lachnospiraceae bacterium]|nr:16S rRNA (guanine(966)-N(2))-methyltransferase RsmD [Lachnospiraceae bacterium]
MRVIAGSARRMLLETPEGKDTRPTQDIIKETLFNMIQFEIPGCVFLDLCAGSGGIGIEALSRGAKKAYFAENGKEACRCILNNLHKTHFDEEGVLLKMDVLNALRHISEKRADIIYIDPPYASDTAKEVLLALAEAPYVTAQTLIIVETSLTSDFDFLEDAGYTLVREKDYHSQRHLFLRRKDGTR